MELKYFSKEQKKEVFQQKVKNYKIEFE